MNTMGNAKRRYSFNNLSPQLLKTLTDIKDFLNLSESQIVRHIYSGDTRLFNSDIKYLVRKGILSRATHIGVYTITKEGSKLVAELTGDSRIYNKQIKSARHELSHDLFVYSAFKHLENTLRIEGKVITGYKTTRLLKSDAAKSGMEKDSIYPNLYIEYVDEANGDKGFINIAVCLNLSTTAILRKFRLKNLVWYTHKDEWKRKIQKLVADANVNAIPLQDIPSYKNRK